MAAKVKAQFHELLRKQGTLRNMFCVLYLNYVFKSRVYPLDIFVYKAISQLGF